LYLTLFILILHGIVGAIQSGNRLEWWRKIVPDNACNYGKKVLALAVNKRKEI